MIELSYGRDKLINKIYNVSQNYTRACFISALGDILGDLLGVEIENERDNPGPGEIIEYKAKINGETIHCNYVNASCETCTRSGEAHIVTSNGIFDVKMGILIIRDDYGNDAHIRRISLDVFDVPDDVRRVGITYSLERDLLGGVSARYKSSEAELQRIINEMWREIQKVIADRN